MTNREPGVRDFTEDQQEPLSNDRTMSDMEFDDFLRIAREMILVREQKVRTANRESELKGGLMDSLETFGDPYGTDGQHRTIEFPKPIRGIARFVRQAKVSNSVDQEKAEAVARQRGIYDRLFKPVTTMVLDESAILVALHEGLLTDEDVDAIFPKRTTYAFIAEKDKK